MKRNGIAMVGLGWMGQALLRKLAARDDVDIRAVVGRQPEPDPAVFAALGLSTSLYRTSYRSVIDDPEIDSIWLANPNHLHGPQAIAAMKAGKHVFCEKPAATTFDDFCTLIDLQNSNPNVVSFVDYILYFDTLEQRLRRMIADGAFGTVTQIQVNYRSQLNIAGSKAWKLSKLQMGDAFGMAINHAISVMLFAMASQTTPVSVFATSQPARLKPFEAHPAWTLQIGFANGATGVCLGNIEAGNGYDAYHNVFGTEGVLVFDPGQARPQKVRYWSQKDTAGKWIWPLDPAKCDSDGLGNLAWPADTSTPDSGDIINHQTGACVEHFLDCVGRGQQSPLSFAGAAQIGEVGWAAQLSAATGKPVALPLDREAAKAYFAEAAR